MNSVNLPEDCAKQWEIILLLLSSEEKKIDRTHETEIDTMNYFYNHKGVRKILLYWLQQMKDTYARKISESDTALKCDEVSLLWRQKGNDKFRANLVEESYKCYTNSVLYAKHKSLMYALALANRSAALLRLKRIQECLSDIALALESGYPIEQRHKLLMRRTDCYIELRQRTEARVSLEEAIKLASNLNMSAANSLEFDRHVKIFEKKIDSMKGDASMDESVILPECYLGMNTHFASASNAIELRYKDKAGRYVVARESTRRGEVLFTEEPYAWVTLPSEDAVCEMCCEADINPVPCSACSRSVYCGSRCASRAISFHRWECAGAQCALYPTIGIAHLALRVLLISASNGFPSPPRPLMQPCTARDLFASYGQVDGVKIYETNTNPFYRMFNLVTNFNKMDNTDYIQYALTATMLTLYLENFTSFFEHLPSRLPHPLSQGQLRLFAAAVILRSLGQLVCNGHATLSLAAVEDTDGRNGRTITEKEIRRATAIYPSAAMMNHSCDPNIINTFYKSRLIVRCARELPAGGEVSNCYGPHRARSPAHARRRALLAQYKFTCDCDSCRDTDRREFVLLFSAYLCPSCKGPVWARGRARPLCAQCRSPLDLERAHALLDRADDLATQAEQARSIEERCEKMAASYRLRQQVWHRHHASLRGAADRLARFYADVGDFSKSMELIKQNIQSLEYRFGSFSVEVAHELRKLSDVMLERILNSPQHLDHREWCLEAHKVIKKAVQLMELNYGSWEPLVSQLRQQEAYLASILAESKTPEAVDCVHRNLHYNLKI